jgi:hypothetical protein
MGQSFYRKEGLDYLYFARPGTAYGSFAQDSKAAQMMGTQTRSQFFKQSGSGFAKPIEMIKSKSLSSDLLQQLWFERAEKTMRHFEHFGQLMDSFQYMADVANRFHAETTPNLKRSFKEEKNEKIKAKKYALIQDIKKFLELYQTYTIRDYDYWDYKNGPMFGLFIEKFENEERKLELQASKLLLDIKDDEDEEQQIVGK